MYQMVELTLDFASLIQSLRVRHTSKFDKCRPEFYRVNWYEWGECRMSVDERRIIDRRTQHYW